MQIVSAGYGFDVPEIQNALMQTNYQSVESAVEYLFQQKMGANGASSNSNSNKKESSSSSQTEHKLLQSLKEAISRMQIDGNMKIDVTADILNAAIKEHQSTDQALNYIMDRYAHLIQPNDGSTVNTKEDAQKLKEKLRDEALRKKQQQEREARDREKQIESDRKRAEAEAKRKEENRKQQKQRIARNRATLRSKKERQKKKQLQSTLEWHKRHEKYDQNDLERLREMEANRSRSAKSIDSPQKALQTLFERYTEDEALSTVAMLSKIIGNIVNDPEEPKYRRISLQNEKIKTLIVTPLGAQRFLEFLGFAVVVEPDPLFPDDPLRCTKFLALSTVKTAECREALAMLSSFRETEKSMVYDLMESVGDDIKPDALWMALMHCHLVLNNILISPQSAFLRMIAVDDAIFKKRVGRFPIFQKFLKSLGFKLEDRVKGRVFVLENANFAYLKNVVRDLEVVARDRVLRTTVMAKGIQKIHALNTANLVALFKFFNAVNKAVANILEEPLNMKYQSLSAQKLKAKFGSVQGMVSVLKLLGFRRSESDRSKFILSAAYTGDLDLLKWRRLIFVQIMNDHKFLNQKT